MTEIMYDPGPRAKHEFMADLKQLGHRVLELFNGWTGEPQYQHQGYDIVRPDDDTPQ